MEKINRMFYIVAWFSILSATAIILTIFFWLWYPYKPIVFLDPVYPLSRRVIHQGDTVSYLSRYCKYTTLSARVTREFMNNLIFVTPTTITNREPGCHSVNIQVLIPEELPMGTYHMHMRYEYQVNPLKSVEVTHDTETFEVTESTSSADTR